jgi:hypothetical protein
MRTGLVASAAVAALAGAQLVGYAARSDRAGWPRTADTPYAPSAGAAPYLSLGYREAAADLMWIRMLAYLGGTDDTSAGVRELVEATLALDDHFRPGYDVGALAIQTANRGVDNAAHLAAIDILERGMRLYPDNWEYPFLAGQVYIVDLVPKDEAQRREWTEKGVLLFERSVRMPGSLERVATTVAHFQEKLGKHELAVKHLEEMILIAQDDGVRDQLIAKLAELEQRDAADLRIAMIESRRAFIEDWDRNRPALPASMYLILGRRRDPYLPREALAVDRDLFGTNPPAVLEPLFSDDEAVPAPPAPRLPGETSDTNPKRGP